MPTHTHTHTFNFSFLSPSLFLSSRFPPATPPRPRCLCVSTCTSSLVSHLTPFEVGDSSRSSHGSLFFWATEGKWLRKRGSTSIKAVNQKNYTVRRDVRNDFWFQSVKAAMCYMHRGACMKNIVHLRTFTVWAGFKTESSLHFTNSLVNICRRRQMKVKTEQIGPQNVHAQAIVSSRSPHRYNAGLSCSILWNIHSQWDLKPLGVKISVCEWGCRIGFLKEGLQIAIMQRNAHNI